MDTENWLFDSPNGDQRWLENTGFSRKKIAKNPLIDLKVAWLRGNDVTHILRTLVMCCVVSCSVVSDPCNPIDCSPPGSSVHGIFQARIVEWVAFPFSRRSSQHMDQTQISHIASRFFTIWATREAQEYWSGYLSLLQWIFPTQELNPGLLRCRQTLYWLSYEGSPLVMGRHRFLIWLEV